MLALLLITGCATEEWSQANGECRGQAHAAYPERYESRVVTRSKLVEVVDGTTSCTTRNIVVGGSVSRPIFETKTDCTQGTKLVNRSFNETVQVDVNENNRSNYAYSCRVNLCIKRFGNKDCESPK